jgi:two-component system nitrogen regulation sensor histidine kinase NtrY
MKRLWARWGGQRPPLPADEARRRRREAIIIAAVTFLFVFFTIFETRVPRFSNSSSLAGNVIFFLLINLNLILLVLLVFLVARNLVKLVLERRHGMFGSRLRTRLVAAFVALTIVPAAVLFLVADNFLTVAIESWFNVRVENALRGSLDVAQSYYQFAANNALGFANGLGQQISDRGLWRAAQRPQLQQLVAEQRVELNVARIEVLGADRTSLASAADDEETGRPPAEPPESIADLFAGHEITSTRRFNRGDIVRAGVPVRGANGGLLGAVLVDYFVPRHVSTTARDIARSYNEYRQLAVMKQPIKTGYLLSLALITLVVIFFATWFGFYQAKNLTIPLQRLAEGTREVAQGNWGHRIEPGTDEETTILIESFNQMTEDLQKMHSEVVERRKYVENILANIAAGVVSLSQTGAVTTVNRAAEAMLGVRLAQVRGRPWSDVFVGTHLREVGEVIRDALNAAPREVERQIRLTGGEHLLTALVMATPLTDDSGAARGLMLFFENVTHLLRVQRMEAWREVARRLAHEIKNPLTPIQLSAQRLQKRYGPLVGRADGQVFDECTRTIVAQVEEVKRLVNEFSTFARLPTVDLTPQNLNAIVDEALVLYREAHAELVFDFEPAADLPLVELDREAIKRALINLLDNAVAACAAVSDTPGRIELKTAVVGGRGAVRLEIADNGCGMSHQVKVRLFEPYFSTKREGTGLGLAIVSAIVADHQAYIRVRDNQPRGTRFIIDFPLRRATSAARLGGREV